MHVCVCVCVHCVYLQCFPLHFQQWNSASTGFLAPRPPCLKELCLVKAIEELYYFVLIENA